MQESAWNACSSLGCGRKLIKCCNGICCIHRNRAPSHIDGYAQGFMDFLCAGAKPCEGLGVKADATIATHCNTQSKGNQLLGFFV